MDCFAALAMTVSGIGHKSAFSQHEAPEFAKDLPQKEGAGNAGCALHPRSRVQNCAKKRTRAYRFSGNTPASPAQWFDGLCRALPGDEFVLSPSPRGLKICPSPVGPTHLRKA